MKDWERTEKIELSVCTVIFSLDVFEATVWLNVIYLGEELTSSRKAGVVQRRDGSWAMVP